MRRRIRLSDGRDATPAVPVPKPRMTNHAGRVWGSLPFTLDNWPATGYWDTARGTRWYFYREGGWFAVARAELDLAPGLRLFVV